MIINKKLFNANNLSKSLKEWRKKNIVYAYNHPYAQLRTRKKGEDAVFIGIFNRSNIL